MRKKLQQQIREEAQNSKNTRTERAWEWRDKKKGLGYVLWLTFLLRQQRRLRRGASGAIVAAAEAQGEREKQEEADAGGGIH